MSSPPATEVEIQDLDAAAARAAVGSLAEILIDCVEGGASVSFMAPLSHERAQAFWSSVADGVARDERILLVATFAGAVVGTCQVILALEENQPHRADVAKVLVSTAARRRGVAERLMRAAETAAAKAGRTLLVLDAVTGGEGERLYERLGWIRVGVIPNFALFPDGQPCATTYFYKSLPESDR